MGQYSKAMGERYSSGEAFLSITESDMERKLGIVNPLHRRKLKLALDELKAPKR